MTVLTASRRSNLGALSEGELVELAKAGNADAVRMIIQTHNQRLYRVARAVLNDESDAEDVVQESYVRAFSALKGFRGDSSLATWLTRIALNEALGRLRGRGRNVSLEALDNPEERDRMQVIPFPTINGECDPERAAARHEMRRMIECAIDRLPATFRVVFVLRDVEGLTVEETAQQLGLRPETVRTRLHRARTRLRKSLDSELASTLTEAFPFGGARCARTATAVVQRLIERKLIK